MSPAILRRLQQAQQELQNGQLEEAAESCERVLRKAPKNAEALWLLGVARLMANRVDEAVPLLERAVAAEPNHGAALEYSGLAHLMRGDYAKAEEPLRKAAAIPHAPPSVFMRLGLALLHQGRHDEAVQKLERAMTADPRSVDTRVNLGRAYAAQGRWGEAREQFDEILQRQPSHVDALYNAGVASIELGDADRARIHFERCLACDPRHIDALERHAAACLKLGRFPQALSDLRRLVDFKPADAALAAVFADATFQCGDIDEALASAAKALELDPAQSGPYSLMAQIHHVRGELDRAVAVLKEGYERTDAGPLLGALVHLTHKQSDWAAWRPAWEAMQRKLDEGGDLGSPFWLLVEPTTPAQQLAYATQWSARKYPPPPGDRPAHRQASRKKRDRVRIGYFSGDFYQHPVPVLMVEVLELHDRERFEVFAYSYGPDDGSAMRARLAGASEHFIDVRWDPDDLLAERLRADELDVLVDLKGYTVGDRLSVLARRPCEMQVSWIGFAGTSGAHFIDGIIGDPFLIPPELEQYYSERVLRVPNCYFPSDRKRPAPPPLSRSEYGLPQDAFVFCCFNQTVKITPEIFARWMALLHALPHAVLWLLEDNRWASENLRSAACGHGIDPQRLVIAPRLPTAQHLARYAAADLALDSAPYTSHTTGSDALWLGCPLVALCGETFAARVSGSLLTNCGLGDLVTYTLDGYEKLAYRLATDTTYMREVRARLALARDQAPLFDSQQFTRDLETLYLSLVQ
ncbi:MAG TPA: tetratricopeptide repeat protein [Burkholderiales bacterium]|nr:tetratricopeptide repeat protein [Burkholderiales bacterium]